MKTENTILISVAFILVPATIENCGYWNYAEENERFRKHRKQWSGGVQEVMTI